MTVTEADQRRTTGPGRLFASTAVSMVGQGAVFAAVPLLAASLTPDPLWVSLATAATYAAWLVVGLPVGALVDRWPLRPTMVVADVVRAVLLLVLLVATRTGAASMPLLVGVVFLMAAAGCFFDPAAQAALPAVVGRSETKLAKANGRFWSIDTFGRSLVGPPLGAVLFGISSSVPFGLGVVTFVASALLLTGLPSGERRHDDAPVGVWASMTDGLRFVASHSRLRLLVLAMGAFNFGYNLAFSTFVLFALDRLGLSATGYGFLVAAPAVGGIIGGFLSPKLQGRTSPPGAYVACLAGQAVVWAVIAVNGTPVVAFVLMVVLGLASNAVTVLGGTARQLLTPDSYLGRVSAATRVVGIGAGAVGAAVGGSLAGSFNLSTPLLAAALWLVVAAAALLPGVASWRRTDQV